MAVKCLWLPHVALLHLWLCMTEQAKTYGVDINIIFEALRAWFELTARNAKARLQELWCEPKMPLQQHATAVERLAEIADS